MNRFLLFAGAHYYPCGGLNDLHKTFETEEEAREYYLECNRKEDYGFDWGHIYDTQEERTCYL